VVEGGGSGVAAARVGSSPSRLNTRRKRFLDLIHKGKLINRQESFRWLGSIVKKARADDARATLCVYIEIEKRMPDYMRPAPEINVWHATRTRTSYCCRLRLRLHAS
jgi:hypothetical protein